MEFRNRKIKFKAWDREHRLLMRLNSIDCQKGELFKRNHVLLQFTGLCDREGDEIYEMDVLMVSLEKFVVFWNEPNNGWCYAPLQNQDQHRPFIASEAERMKRFCSYFELDIT